MHTWTREEAAARSEQWQDRFTMNGEGEWVLREDANPGLSCAAADARNT